MEISQKVTNKELSKKIWDLGWKLDTEFWWVEWHGGYAKSHMSYEKSLKWELRYKSNIGLDQNKVPAPLACELGEVLPAWKFIKGRGCSLSIYKIGSAFDNEKRWVVEYRVDEDGIDSYLIKRIKDRNLANTLSKMLIYLTKQGLVKP
jgi:hypothetical protein